MDKHINEWHDKGEINMALIIFFHAAGFAVDDSGLE